MRHHFTSTHVSLDGLEAVPREKALANAVVSTLSATSRPSRRRRAMAIATQVRAPQALAGQSCRREALGPSEVGVSVLFSICQTSEKGKKSYLFS